MLADYVRCVSLQRAILANLFAPVASVRSRKSSASPNKISGWILSSIGPRYGRVHLVKTFLAFACVLCRGWGLFR